MQNAKGAPAPHAHRRTRCPGCGLLLHRNKDGSFPAHAAPCGLPCRTRETDVNTIASHPTLRQVAIEWGYHQVDGCPVCQPERYLYNGPMGTASDPTWPAFDALSRLWLDLAPQLRLSTRNDWTLDKALERVTPANRKIVTDMFRLAQRHARRVATLQAETERVREQIHKSMLRRSPELTRLCSPKVTHPLA